MKSTVVLLRRNSDRNMVCSCGNNDSWQLTVVGVDRLGFITGVQCSLCQKELDLSPLEERYVVQTLYHGQSDQTLDGEHAARVLELCNLLCHGVTVSIAQIPFVRRVTVMTANVVELPP